MQKIKTLIELREFIVYLEEKYDLLDFDIDGVKPWQLMRVAIDYDFGRVAGLMEIPHTKLSFKHKVKNLFSLIKNFFFKNPFLSNGIDIVVFSHPRVKKVDNRYIDIYTYYFIENLKKEGKNFIEMETPYLGEHLSNNERYKYYTDFVLITRKIFSKFIKIKIHHSKLDKILKINQEIRDHIGDYDLVELFLKSTKQYKIEYFLYKRLFTKLKPSKIYLVVSYGFGAMIKAAKDLNIETIEFQHGNFSKYHFGYYFGEEKKNLDYFPDKFYVWNDYWKDKINFPINDDSIIIKKFDYLENKKLYYKKQYETNKKQALVLSQGVLGDRIAQKIYENWEFFKQFKLIYKLHPGEYDRYKSYKYLKILHKEYGVKIVTDEIDLYQLFATSKYQVGVYSTALYEGVEFECETILLDLPGVEEMDKFKEIYKTRVIN